MEENRANQIKIIKYELVRVKLNTIIIFKYIKFSLIFFVILLIKFIILKNFPYSIFIIEIKINS